MDLNLFQKDVAEIVGVSEATVCNWEKNGTQPEVEHMPKIIHFLGYVPFMCPDDILGRLAYLKKIKGLTLPGLGKLMGRDPEQLSDWLNIRIRPRRRNLESINQFLSKHGLHVV
jgi:transcriptional regulator with XRE-family HTH domain